VEKATPFRDRKGEKTQNVLAACTFDLQFSGWEGSAHDTRVLQDALDKNAFSLPPGKFYLADAGYTCRWPFLVPYSGIRYHLREQNLANLRPKNKEELFNLRHSSLRNAIERIFVS
jgi:DDE superfamily endonuclease